MSWLDKLKQIVCTPNFMTLTRILVVPAIVILLMSDSRAATFTAALLFSLASITDYFDGYLARKYGLVSNLGKILDPVAKPTSPPQAARSGGAQSGHVGDSHAQTARGASTSTADSATRQRKTAPQSESTTRGTASKATSSSARSSRLYERLSAARQSSFGEVPRKPAAQQESNSYP